MSDQLRYAFQFGTAPAARPRDPDQPLRILVMGDFSGRGSAGIEDRPSSKPRRVDVDNFDSLLSSLKPTFRVPLGDSAGAEMVIEITDIEDFHPDQLYHKLPVFQQLRQLRKQLLDPSTFAAAAAQLQSLIPYVQASTATAEPSSVKAADESDTDTLQRILGSSSSVADGGRPATEGLDQLIGQIVAPYIEPIADPRRDQYVSCIDQAIAEQMRNILHHPAFQSCESNWLGLQFLISHVEISGELQISIWDISREEILQAAHSETQQLQDSSLFDLLVTAREQDPYSLYVSTETIDQSEQDLSLVGLLGTIAAHSGGALLAAAAPGLLGCHDWTDSIDDSASSESVDSWHALRTSSVAASIALIAPRVLLRLPYGVATSPIDAFEFEEIESLSEDNGAFLWGSPALACASLIGMSFVESGWEMSLNDQLELDDLPAVTFKLDGESALKPCAEVLLAERGGEAMLSQGVMPLMSFKNRNAARLLRFQSIAEPLTALAGPWA